MRGFPHLGCGIIPTMTGETAPPKFLSLEFHARFFPRLLLDRLRRKGREPGGTTFTPDM